MLEMTKLLIIILLFIAGTAGVIAGILNENDTGLIIGHMQLLTVAILGFNR